jgi:exodeoxyribonuclease X
MLKSRIAAFDTETTGTLDPIELIEFGCIYLNETLEPIENSSISQRYKPTRNIEYSAMAVHKIVDADLIDCPSNKTFIFDSDIEYGIAHNIDYDCKVLNIPETSIKRIDTLSMARKTWPNLYSYTLTALIYYLNPQNMHQSLRDNIVKNAHGVIYDIKMGLFLLKKINHITGAQTIFLKKKKKKNHDPEQIARTKFIPDY